MRRTLWGELCRFGRTVRWSWQGWRAAWATEKSLRQWFVANILSAGAAFALDLATAERALVLALGLAVLAMELVNTAIETLCDHVRPEPDDMMGKAKDCASAAVALTALAAGVAWLIVLLG